MCRELDGHPEFVEDENAEDIRRPPLGAVPVEAFVTSHVKPVAVQPRALLAPGLSLA